MITDYMAPPYIKDVESMWASLYAILNKGGHLLIVDFDQSSSMEPLEDENNAINIDSSRPLSKTEMMILLENEFVNGDLSFSK